VQFLLQAGRGWISDRVWKTNLTNSYLGTIFKFLVPKGNSDPIVQIVVDNSRRVLFTRTATGALQVSVLSLLIFFSVLILTP